MRLSVRCPRTPPPQVCLPEVPVAQQPRWPPRVQLEAQTCIFPTRFFVFIILPGPDPHSPSFSQQISWVYRGCTHRLAHSFWTHNPRQIGLEAQVTKATESNAPDPGHPEVRSFGGCRCALFPGDFVEEHRWGTPPAGTLGQLMDRLISRLDGPEPGLAGRWVRIGRGRFWALNFGLGTGVGKVEAVRYTYPN